MPSIESAYPALDTLSSRSFDPCLDNRVVVPPLDEFTGVHNNSFMNHARLAPATVLVNLVGSMGAAG